MARADDSGSRQTRLRVRGAEVAQTVGMAVAGLPFLALGLVFVVALPAAAALWISRQAAETSTAFETAVVTLLVVTAVAVAWWALVLRRVVERAGNRFGAAIAAMSIGSFATSAFAILTAFLGRQGVVDIGMAKARTYDGAVDAALEFYVWHLLNSVPFLDIPANLQWARPYAVADGVSGLLLISYKAIVILPLLPLVKLLIPGSDRTFEDAVRKAVRSARPKPRLAEPPRGFERAIVVTTDERHVLVDSIQHAPTEDAALRRLSRAAAYHLIEKIDAYLLVVDVVGERARDRIDARCRETAMPAKLLVWRSDEPPGFVVDAVAELAAEVDRAPAMAAPVPA